MKAEDRLKELGIILPVPNQPQASYVSCVQTGNLVFVSGQGTLKDGKRLYVGKLGKDLNKEGGYLAAKVCALNALAQLKQHLGSLDRVTRIVHIKGFVASDTEFSQQSWVINGASDLMIEIFGDAGKHSRTAIGVNILPNNISVEIELIAEVL